MSRNHYSNQEVMSTPSALDLVGDPLRVRVVRRLSEHGAATLSELAEAANVHANTLRPHLVELEQAGALTRETGAPSGRGRPTLRYRLADDWRMPAADLRELAELLAALVLRLGPEHDQIETFGRDWGRFLAGRPGRGALAEGLPPALERLGFNARLEGDRVLLSSCPCPLIAPDRPELLCTLAVGVIDGLAASSGGPERVASHSHDPVQRRCSVTLSRSGRRRRAPATRRRT